MALFVTGLMSLTSLIAHLVPLHARWEASLRPSGQMPRTPCTWRPYGVVTCCSTVCRSCLVSLMWTNAAAEAVQLLAALVISSSTKCNDLKHKRHVHGADVLIYWFGA